jgi:hypothetical protein
MKFKGFLLACATLSMTTASKADFKNNLNTCFAKALEFVQSEKTTRSTKIGIGGITTIGSSFFLFKVIKEGKMSRINKVRAQTFLISGIISGCYMLNDGLNKVPGEYIKSLSQKVKMKLQPKVNE